MQESQRRDAAVSRKVNLAPVKASSELNHPPPKSRLLIVARTSQNQPGSISPVVQTG